MQGVRDPASLCNSFSVSNDEPEYTDGVEGELDEGNQEKPGKSFKCTRSLFNDFDGQ